MQKKRKAVIIILLTAIMTCIALLVSRYDENVISKVLPDLVFSDDMIISAWMNDENSTMYYFIPSYVEMKDAAFIIDEGKSVKIDDMTISREDNLDGLAFNQKYTLIDQNDKKQSVVFLKSHNVSTVYVSTATGSIKSVLQSKERKEQAKVVVVDQEGNVDLLKTDAQIKGRGNSTWINCKKKPFSIVLNSSESVLGMAASSKWALLANAMDYSSIRNAIVFDTARKLGLEATPEYEYIDLYLNGSYNGLYMICQPAEMFYEKDDVDESNLYLFTSELSGRLEDMNYKLYAEDNEAYIDVCYPQQLHSYEKEVAESIVKKIDFTINNEADNIGDIIDIDSWAKKYLIDEIFENYDSGLASSYFYTFANDDSKVYAGPVWDYDRILGNRHCLSGTTLNPEILYAKQKYRGKNKRILWYSELYLNATFYNEIVNIYQSEFKPIIDSLIANDLDRIALEIRDAKKNDDLRWGIDSTEEYSYMKDYIVKREEFLNDVWLNQNDYVEITYYKSEDDSDYMRVFVPKGSSLSDNAETIEQFAATDKWYIEGTSKVYNYDLPIKEDIVLVTSSEGKISKNNLSTSREQMKVVVSVFSIIVLWILLCFFKMCTDFRKG